jgi:hypothetical protein
MTPNQITRANHGQRLNLSSKCEADLALPVVAQCRRSATHTWHVMNIPTKCPKCEGEMQEGFILDLTEGPRMVASWVGGKPEKSRWTGTKVHSARRRDNQPKPKRMKDKLNIKGLVLGLLFGTFIVFVTSTVGCTTSWRGPGADAAHAPVLDATQACRQTLNRIYGAKAEWALENRKTENEIPTDADLFGPGRYMPEKPKCPSGGRYTLGAGWENPRCSISGHTY